MMEIMSSIILWILSDPMSSTGTSPAGSWRTGSPAFTISGRTALLLVPKTENHPAEALRSLEKRSVRSGVGAPAGNTEEFLGRSGGKRRVLGQRKIRFSAAEMGRRRGMVSMGPPTEEASDGQGSRGSPRERMP